MLVGNDLVDLRVSAAEPPHPRFFERVCTAEELRWLHTADDRAARGWALFAAKEAAYKALSRRNPGLAFAHRAFVVSSDGAAVQYGTTTLDLQLEQTADYVHAIATTDPALTHFAVREIAASHDPSSQVRKLACERIADLCGCGGCELAIVRSPRASAWDGYEPPCLLNKDEPSSLVVSLSHHGRYVAYAAVGSFERCARSSLSSSVV